MLQWLSSLTDKWEWGVLLLSLLPLVAAFAHMMYYIYIVPDDEDDVTLGYADEGLAATTLKGGTGRQLARGGKKHRRKHA